MHSNVDAVVVEGNNWREIDRELRTIAKRQRALDAEEAGLLCVVARQQIWRQFGCATMLEYLEMIFGYGPKVGHERVRVAMALEALPELRDALANGEVSYSALRELTRVVTRNTQREWLDAVRGKSVREVEDLVRTHRKGDLPTDPGDPDLKPRRLQFEVSTATDALLRQARQALANERGRFVEDDEFLAAMAASLLEGGANDNAGDNDAGRAKFQVRVTTCDACAQTYFEGGGRKIAVGDADAARADCDAQRIGSDERAAQDIAPKTRRDVLHRDGGKCTVPRCRSARFIEVHHIVPRSEGGSHDASNLTSLCDGHHKALHEGKLQLRGRAPNITVRFANDPATPHVETHVAARHADRSPHVENRTVARHADRSPHVENRTVARHADRSPHVETRAAAQHAENHTVARQAERSPHVENHTVARHPDRSSHVETRVAAQHAENHTVARQAERSPHTVARHPDRSPHVETRAAAQHAENHTVARQSERSSHVTRVTTRHVEPTIASSTYSTAVMRAEAVQALKQLGFAPSISSKCVDAALASRPPPATLEQLIRGALQHSR